jgi:hypothetical protein
VAQNSGIKVGALLLTSLALITGYFNLSDHIPTRIEVFRSSAYSVPSGDHITLTWRVKGYQNHVFLDGQSVANDDAREFTIDSPRSFTLTTRGFWGGEEKRIDVNVLRAQRKPFEPPSNFESEGSFSAAVPPPAKRSPQEYSGTENAALRDPIELPISVATLDVEAKPASRVVIDGKDRGATDIEGHLVLPDLAAGAHSISVVKAGYGPVEQKVVLAASEYKRLPVELNWMGGYLTVTASPTAAAIEIQGLGTFNGNVSNLPCPPGTYAVSITREGMKGETRSITVQAGQHTNLAVSLTPVGPDEHAELLRAEAFLAGGDTPRARSIAYGVLKSSPNNSEALGMIPQTYWKEGNYREFIETAIDAVQRGSAVTVTLMHDDNRGGRYLHPVALTLSSAGITYDPQGWTGTSCTLPKGTVQVQGAQIQKKLYRDVRGGNFEEVFLQMTFNPVGSAGPRSLSLWTLGSRVTARQVIRGRFVGMVLNSSLVESPGSSVQAFDSLLTVVHAVPERTAQR